MQYKEAINKEFAEGLDIRAAISATIYIKTKITIPINAETCLIFL